HARPSRTAPSSLVRRLEQLDGVAVRVFELNLPARRTGFHFIPKPQACLFQRFDASRQIGYAKDDPVPSAGFLTMTVRHQARTRRARAAEKDPEVFDRDGSELRQLLVFQLEAQVPGIELGRAA